MVLITVWYIYAYILIVITHFPSPPLDCKFHENRHVVWMYTVVSPAFNTVPHTLYILHKICWINESASDSCRYWPAECFHMILPIQICLVSFSFLFISTSTILALATGGPYLEVAGWLSYLQLSLFSYYSPHSCTVVLLMCRSVQDTPLHSAVVSMALRIKFKLSNETMWDRLDLPPVNSWASPLHTPRSSHPHSFSALRGIVHHLELLTRSCSPSFVRDVPLAGNTLISLG